MQHISIVINTLNRASYLTKTLHSLQYLEYPNFEVIVVNGPSSDNTEEVLRDYQANIKVGHCPVKNLAVSRNIGIAMSQGDIIAFIDDDAIPEPLWLNKIIEGYDHEEVAGVGGPVYDHTGYQFQWQYVLGHRIEGHKFLNHKPDDSFCIPGGMEFVSMTGTNATFRRDLLLKIGGFDEQYDYCLDETDVCVRLIDAGYIIRNVDHAYVHHKYAPSHLRNNQTITDYTPYVKNLIYFLYKNYLPVFQDKNKILQRIMEAVTFLQDEVNGNYHAKKIDAAEHKAALASIYEGLNQGFLEATPPRKLLKNETLTQNTSDYKSFVETLKKFKLIHNGFPRTYFPPQKRLVICLVSYGYPPYDYWGIARCTYVLATNLARRGHHVHVVYLGRNDWSTVDYDQGVWIHAFPWGKIDEISLPENCRLPLEIWRNGLKAYEEVKRIQEHHGYVDVVQVPIWDCWGLLFLEDEYLRNKLVTSLYTTCAVEKSISNHWQNNKEIETALNIMIKAEKHIIENSRHIYVNTQAIIDSFEKLYEIKIPKEKHHNTVIPHSVFDIAPPAKNSGIINTEDDFLKILFVGRLQARKGIDILLECIPSILTTFKRVKFFIVGNDTFLNEKGFSYKTDFLTKHANQPFLERVIFTGQVEEEDLVDYYAGCDLLVAPSLYESFGLIFLEAMRFSKPVIGCRAGGMVEIIQHGVNGFLIEPNDVESLKNAIEILIIDDNKRHKFGVAARKIYEEKFNEAGLAEKSLHFYQQVANNLN